MQVKNHEHNNEKIRQREVVGQKLQNNSEFHGKKTSEV
jgi:hypothetical protein